MTSNPTIFGNSGLIIRSAVFLLLGAAAGYWVLPLVMPHPFSHKIEWLVSPVALAIAGAILGAVIGYRASVPTAVITAGGLIGAIVGRIVSVYGAMFAAYLWYEILSLERPKDTIVFLDAAELLVWVLLGAGGALIGWRIARMLVENS